MMRMLRENMQIKKLPWRNIFFVILLGFIGAANLDLCINTTMDLSYSNSILSFFVCICWAIGLYKITKSNIWEKTGVGRANSCFVAAFLFFYALNCGVSLDRIGKVVFSDWLVYMRIAGLALAFVPYLAWGIYKLENMHWKDAGKTVRISEKRYFICTFVILFLAYLITLLAVWPGFFSYDAEVTVYMVFTQKYSALCPRIHVLLLGGVVKAVYALTKSYNLGIAVYFMMQITVLAVIFAYMMTFLYRIGAHRILRILGIGYLALFPAVSMHVCCSTKDGLFAGGVTLLTTLLLELAYEEEAFWQSVRKKVLFVLASLMVCTFRNNGLYAYIPFAILLCFLYCRYWKKCICVLGVTMITLVVMTTAIDRIFSFQPGPIAEMFCVPMQQLARVHSEKKEELGEEDKEILYDLIPEVVLERYNPKLADHIKLNFMSDHLKADPGKFLSLWARWGCRYPEVYVNSFLHNTYGYWYPDTVLDGYRNVWIVDRQYGDSCYFQFVTERPGERHSLIPWLERFYEKISLEIYQQKFPVVSMFFSIGFWHWVYVFLAFFLVQTKSRRLLTAFLPTGLIYLTVLLGPIALVRYVVYFFFCAPLALVLLLQKEVFDQRNMKQ